MLHTKVQVGVLLGSMVGMLTFFPVVFLFGMGIGQFVSLSLVSICTIAALSGSVLPPLAKRVGVDPAVVSAPLITTLVDATGLVIYFLIAKAFLGL